MTTSLTIPSASSVVEHFPINTPQSLITILSEPGWIQMRDSEDPLWWQFNRAIGCVDIELSWYGKAWVADYSSAMDCCDSDEGYYAVTCTGKEIQASADLVRRIEEALSEQS